MFIDFIDRLTFFNIFFFKKIKNKLIFLLQRTHPESWLRSHFYREE